ncbi:4'-phosphopantetheinyl transferase family protein [Paeniglutamicibacter sp. NPDC012692]|uniref:4'-phosphopantetheinyl transferase family protein n=1 Tax=Paeniglutamicibacter sp. NPDC012692 TaxID=3364388 RepID=UPI0036B0F680
MARRQGKTPGTDVPEGGPWWAVAPLADASRHPDIRLAPPEIERAGGYLPGRPREDFVAGRILVRALAAELLGRAMPPARGFRPDELELTQCCPKCASSRHGIPRLRAPRNGQSFSLSYARTAGWLLLGLAPANWRIGVDLADLNDPAFAPGDGDSEFEDFVFAPGELAELDALPADRRQHRRAQWWALKEAVAKAAGEGIAGAGGIPVVAGPKRHLLLRSPGTRAMDLGPGTPDTLGNVLPGNLVGSVVWAPN